jgi:hypothetical protein
MYATRAAKATQPRCPCCGQLTASVRLGVPLYPQTARILDLIVAAGPDGVEARALFSRAYSHRGRHKPSFRSLNGQVRVLRIALQSTKYTITCRNEGLRLWIYRLVQRNVVPEYGATTTAHSVPDTNNGSALPTKC